MGRPAFYFIIYDEDLSPFPTPIRGIAVWHIISGIYAGQAEVEPCAGIARHTLVSLSMPVWTKTWLCETLGGGGRCVIRRSGQPGTADDPAKGSLPAAGFQAVP